jgi:serine/threonine-protein kinase
VKLLDFGVARAAEPEEQGLTSAGERVGSLHAMAPELVRGGAADARADVYGLGVLLYQMLTGTLPFWSEDPLELERLHLTAPPPRPSRLAPVPPAIDAVVEAALAKDPALRTPTPLAVLEALRAAAAGAPREERDAAAVAIHVAVVARDPLDVDAALALAALEDDAAARLGDAGFELDVRAPGALLATRLVAASDAAADRARGVAVGRDLRDGLARAAGPAARIQVCVHAGEVRVAAGGRRAGGPLFRTAEWVRDTADGFAATSEALS